MTAVSLRGIGKAYGDKDAATFAALHDVDLDVETGEFLVLTGRSGCGKTTLLNIASGLATPTSGSVKVEGVDLWSISDAERSSLRNRTMGFVFQFPSLHARAHAGAERDAAARVQRQEEHRTPPSGRASCSRRSASAIAPTRCRASSPPGSSSGWSSPGRSSTSPRSCWPTSRAATSTRTPRREIMEIFSRIHGEQGITVMMATHARNLIAFGTRHLEMADGTVRPDGVAAAGNGD